MKGISICHYSYHRTWEAKKWSCDDLVDAVAGLGVGAVDFHIRYLGDSSSAGQRVGDALGRSGLELSGLSMSNNFNQIDPTEFRREIDAVVEWMRVAAEVEAPVSRIFGGHCADRADSGALSDALTRVRGALEEVTREAEKLGVVLALENHGGLPCLGAEQVEVIDAIGSPHLRATVDIGNYMGCGQEGVDGTRIAAPRAAYVHVKDMEKVESSDTPWGWGIQSCTVGQGSVDVPGCLRGLAAAGYDGYVALEYEGPEDEAIGVPESVAYMKQVLEAMGA